MWRGAQAPGQALPAGMAVVERGRPLTGGGALPALPDLPGLMAADTGTGHFPAVSPYPPAVGEGRQSAVVRFGALGFRAAAVTALMPVAAGTLPRYPYETTAVRVTAQLSERARE
ncbi:hypothetical protein ACWERI_19860 [Streptomyces collinus]